MPFFNNDLYINDLITTIGETVNIGNLADSKILIIGATGTIGTYLVDTLLEFNRITKGNVSIYATSRNRANLVRIFGNTFQDKLHFVSYDLCGPSSFDFDADYVIHTAGNAYPGAFHSDPVGTITGNVLGTYNLLEYARAHRVKRFLFVSSGEIYGQGDPKASPYEESYSGYVDCISPRSCYPNSKRTAESLCASYSKQYGLDTVIVRPCHTYGPWISGGDNRANAQFIENAVEGKDIVLKSEGKQRRSYCYVADCVSAVLSVLLNGKTGEAYNIANKNSVVSIAEMAHIIAETAGQKVLFETPDKIDIKSRSPIEQQILCSKKLEALGWKAVFNIETGMKHIIAIRKSRIGNDESWNKEKNQSVKGDVQ